MKLEYRQEQKKQMKTTTKDAAELHKNVPPNWYHQSIRINAGQKFWHETRFKEVGKIIEKVDGKILDIGCADGVFTNVILKNSGASEVIGIDVLKSSVDWAKNHWKKNKKLKFKVGNAHDLKFANNTFSTVFALEVLEHVPEPLKVMKEVKRVLKKGGYGVFLVPSDNTLFKIIWYFWTKFWRGKIWDDCHIQSYSDDGLARVCEKAGLVVELDKYFLLGMLNVIKVRKK